MVMHWAFNAAYSSLNNLNLLQNVDQVGMQSITRTEFYKMLKMHNYLLRK
jgi:hypothetical protein